MEKRSGPMPTIIPVGTRFGKLTVVGDRECIQREQHERALPYYPCLCDCGTRIVTLRKSLVSGKAKSCGCSVNRRRNSEFFTREHKDGRIYGIWRAMMNRCYRTKNVNYIHYGERGIAVCLDWHEYSTFQKWALGNGYDTHLTLDRYPDKNGNYEPVNCRWATNVEQGRNRRNNRLITAFGECKPISEWASDPRCAVSHQCLRSRISHGMDHHQAVTTPPMRSARNTRRLSK